MRVIGITGGIGSGKTTVCGIFAELGVAIYNADERAKAVMIENGELRGAVKAKFGDEAYNQDGTLNRPYLAERVFRSKKELAALNGLVHPAVARDFTEWSAKHGKDRYVIKEAAILFESGAYKLVQESVLVTAPKEMRVQRVVQRDGATEEEVIARMDNQWPEEQKAELANHIVVNDGRHLLIPQVLELHRKFSS